MARSASPSERVLGWRFERGGSGRPRRFQHREPAGRHPGRQAHCRPPSSVLRRSSRGFRSAMPADFRGSVANDWRKKARDWRLLAGSETADVIIAYCSNLSDRLLQSGPKPPLEKHPPWTPLSPPLSGVSFGDVAGFAPSGAGDSGPPAELPGTACFSANWRLPRRRRRLVRRHAGLLQRLSRRAACSTRYERLGAEPGRIGFRFKVREKWSE